MSISVRSQDGMFSAGDAYERFMGRWSRELAPLLVAFAEVRNGDEVLDVGSGTGALTRAVAAAAPISRIVGIDAAAPYVAFAQAHHPGDLIRFEVGDAQQLRFLGGSFHKTLSLLVLNFIPDPATALSEMIRVTRPGGSVTAAVWDYGQEMEMLRVFWDEAVALNRRPRRATSDTCPSVVRENLGLSGADTGCGTCRRRRSPSECSSPRSMITGRPSWTGRVRQADTLPLSRHTARAAEADYAGGSSAMARIVQSCSGSCVGRPRYRPVICAALKFGRNRQPSIVELRYRVEGGPATSSRARATASTKSLNRGFGC